MSQLRTVVGAGTLMLAEAIEYSLEQRSELTVIGKDVTVQGLVAKVCQLEPDVAIVCADGHRWDGIAACSAVKGLANGTRVVVIGPAHEDGTLLAAVKAGADGFVTDTERIDDLVGSIRQVSRGQSRIPSTMLGALLRGLIEFRREDDAVFERFASLGKREREVLTELVRGANDQAIASKLHLSPHTARTHVQNILNKLGVHSRLEAARMVIEHDILGRFGIEAGEPQPGQRRTSA